MIKEEKKQEPEFSRNFTVTVTIVHRKAMSHWFICIQQGDARVWVLNLCLHGYTLKAELKNDSLGDPGFVANWFFCHIDTVND